MLTKSDLKQIGNVIDERLEEKLEPIKEDLGKLQKDMKGLKKKVNKIDKTVDIIARNYDKEDVKLQRRVSKIEEHLSLPI